MSISIEAGNIFVNGKRIGPASDAKKLLQRDDQGNLRHNGEIAATAAEIRFLANQVPKQTEQLKQFLKDRRFSKR